MSVPNLDDALKYLDYDPNTGNFTWKYRTDLKPKAASWNERNAGKTAGFVDGKGYLTIAIHKIKYRAHRVAWLMYYRTPPNLDVDHINRVKSDNRISNLRLATVAQNGHNVDICSRNTSGCRGVFWHRSARKWQAGICYMRKEIYLGLFEKYEDAVAARRAAEKKYYGEFAVAA